LISRHDAAKKTGPTQEEKDHGRGQGMGVIVEEESEFKANCVADLWHEKCRFPLSHPAKKCTLDAPDMEQDTLEIRRTAC